MKRTYLKDNDQVWAECFLLYDAKNNTFIFDGITDDSYFDGIHLEFDEDDKPYIET